MKHKTEDGFIIDIEVRLETSVAEITIATTYLPSKTILTLPPFS